MKISRRRLNRLIMEEMGYHQDEGDSCSECGGIMYEGDCFECGSSMMYESKKALKKDCGCGCGDCSGKSKRMSIRERREEKILNEFFGSMSPCKIAASPIEYALDSVAETFADTVMSQVPSSMPGKGTLRQGLITAFKTKNASIANCIVKVAVPGCGD